MIIEIKLFSIGRAFLFYFIYGSINKLCYKNQADNGKIILFNGNDDITSGCLYLIKRLCGEGMYKALLSGV